MATQDAVRKKARELGWVLDTDPHEERRRGIQEGKWLYKYWLVTANHSDKYVPFVSLADCNKWLCNFEKLHKVRK